MQAGEHILREGEALDEAAKFFVLEAGEVDCRRTFEVGTPQGGVCVGSGRECVEMGRRALRPAVWRGGLPPRLRGG